MDIDIHGINKKLFIVLIAVLFFSLFYTSGTFNWITGKHSGFCAGSCVDTDKGSIYYKGKVTYTTDTCREFERIDYCDESRSGWLKEYNCDTTTPDNYDTESVYCDNGCKYGACQ